MAVLRTRFVPRPIGYLMALSGITYLVQGWIVGVMGFDPAELPTVTGILLNLVWSIWFLVRSWVETQSHILALTSVRARSVQVL